MNLRKILLILLMGLFLFGAGYWYFFSEGPDWKARRAFEEGNWQGAEQELHTLQAKTPPAEYALFTGYIARETGTLQESNNAFQTALEANPPFRLKEEILINQAYNAFLMRNPEQMQKALKGLEKKRSNWYHFLNALYVFLRNSNGENLAKLQDINVPPSLSPWMAKAFSLSFTPFWFAKQTALTLIDEGNTVQARQQLEKIAHATTSEEKEEIAFLTGLSYLKEAQERPFLAATPYYKLAFSYFERVPFQEPRFQTGRRAAVAQIDKQIEQLIEEKHYENIPFYTGLVDKWGEMPDKEKLAAQLAELINQEGYLKPLAEALSRLSSIPGFKEKFQQKALTEIQNTSFETTNSAKKLENSVETWNPSLQNYYLQSAQEAFASGEFELAEKKLQIALQILPLTKAISKEVLPLSAQIFMQKDDPYDAVLAWNKSFSIQPLDALYRVDYGRALMEVLRFDLATNQFAFMAQNAHLNSEEELLFIDSLIQSGHFNEAKEMALEMAPRLDGKDVLRLSAIVFPLKDKSLNDALNERIPPKDQWDGELKLSAFQTALEKGDYDLAARLYAAEKTLLNKTGFGKFLLAKFYSQIGNPKTSLKYAQEAQAIDPALPGLDAFIEQHSYDANVLKQRLLLTESALKQDPLSLSQLFKRGQILIDLSIASQDNSKLPMAKMPDLRSAYALLQGLKEKGQEFPFYHFLFGLASFLLDEDETASKSFEKAIQLNPGYSDAAKYLALVYSKAGNTQKAAEVLLTALKFHPSDGEGWQVLADVYLAAGDGLEAGSALENALRYRPNNINTLLSVANYKLELQNPLAAQELVDKALKINPQNQRALILKIKILNNPLLTEHQSVSDLEKKTRKTLDELRKVNPTLATKIEKELQL